MLIKHAKLIVICWFGAMALHHAGLLMQFSQQVWFSLLELKTYFKITEFRTYPLFHFHFPPSLFIGWNIILLDFAEYRFPTWGSGDFLGAAVRWLQSLSLVKSIL